jgi:FKBP-type peptidyl-prolyl cis-trans isomerase FklB
MRNLFLFIIGLLAVGAVQAQQLENSMDSVSYSVGVLLAQSLKQQGLDKVDPKVLSQGISDVLTGADLQIDVNEANQIFQQYAQKRAEESSKEAVAAGQAFLKENGQRPEVTTTASGLQYLVINEGEGASPKATDKVTVHYRGTLLNGKEFDSSYRRGQPASFPVNGVIPGWVEALQLMKVGSKWRLFIPSELAYGARGAGQDIGPNETLVFEVELLEIN